MLRGPTPSGAREAQISRRTPALHRNSSDNLSCLFGGAHTVPLAAIACPARLQLLNHKKNGDPFINYLSITPIYDAAGRLTHYVGIQSDVTELVNHKRAELAAKHAALQVSQGEAARAIRLVVHLLCGRLPAAMCKMIDHVLQAPGRRKTGVAGGRVQRCARACHLGHVCRLQLQRRPSRSSWLA
jgi:hypothetical protein